MAVTGAGGDERAEVVRREMSLLAPEVRRDPEMVRALLHPDFREFGASGRVWDATAVAAALASEEPTPLEAFDLVAERLADDVVLVTYSVAAAGQLSRRSSVWVRVSGRGWLLRFHQGTPAHPASADQE